MRRTIAWLLMGLTAVVGASRTNADVKPSPPKISAEPLPAEDGLLPENESGAKDAPPEAAALDQIVVAQVGETAITAGQVQRLAKTVARSALLTENNATLLQRQALRQLIDRELVTHYLDEQHVMLDEDQLVAALEKLKAAAASQNISFDQLLAQRAMSLDEIHKELAWELRWKQYLDDTITDEMLEQYFTEHHREFDDTQLRVSHILFRPPAALDQASLTPLVQQAENLRKQLVAKQLDFAEACARYSSGPSRHNGGDLGFIGRQAPMVEPFAKAAFELEVGQLSEPVVTPFGVHLILCTEIKSGKKTWQEVRQPLLASLQRHLFSQCASRMHGKVEVRVRRNVDAEAPATP